MAPLVALVIVFTVTFAACRIWAPRADALTGALRAGVAAMFLLTGIARFGGMWDELVAMVPPWLPAPEFWVLASGLVEIALALALGLRALVPWAALGLTLLLVAVFPANVFLALTAADLPWWQDLLPRTIMQVIFLTATITLFLRTRRPLGQRAPRRAESADSAQRTTVA